MGVRECERKIEPERRERTAPSLVSLWAGSAQRQNQYSECADGDSVEALTWLE